MLCPGEHLVVHGVCADDSRFAAGSGRVQAQQSDQIGAVGVEVLPEVGAVLAHARPGCQTLVADMGQDVGVPVLSDGIAQHPAQCKEGPFDLRVGEFVDRKPAQPHEARTSGEDLSPVPRRGAQLLGQRCDVATAGVADQRLPVGLREVEGPVRLLGEVAPRPHRGRLRGDRRPHCGANSSISARTRPAMSSRIRRTTSIGWPAGSSSFQSR